MPPEPTARDCLAACDRLAARLDLMRAELQALYAGAEATLASWAPPPGWDEW
jgi:hypothetical protein